MHAWQLTQRISPRAHVQLARALDDGTPAPSNSYPDRANVAGPCPALPWVVNLTDEDGTYWLLAFDFDAHHLPVADAQADAYSFVALLERLGNLPYLVCESGPSGGLHVWLAPRSGLPAATVAAIAAAGGRLYPTLDTSPLRNPTTGGVRPPGSPHRDGGRSTILFGDTSDLTTPTATTAAFATLLRELEQLAPPPSSSEPAHSLTLVDHRGRLYLPGTRSSLGAAATAALQRPPSPDTDASAVLFSVLLGAARARWRFDDLHALLDTAPGLEHARSTRHGQTRLPRTPRDQHRVLAYQWDRAVRHVAATRVAGAGTSSGELTERAATVTHVVAAALAHMNASPGRWTDTTAAETSRGAYGQHRATDRLVLLELYQRALDGLTTTVRAAVRTLAMALPFERESVRASLKRLAADGWIALANPSDGPHAATWSIDPHGVFHKEAAHSRSATGLAPVASSAPPTWNARTQLQRRLSQLTEGAAHDVFLADALGPQAGYAYAIARMYPGESTRSLAVSAAVPLTTMAEELERLAVHGLVKRSDRSWYAHDSARRDTIAQFHGVGGTREARAHRYRIEQATWAYWLAEVAATTRATALTTSHYRVITLPTGATIALGSYPRRANRAPQWSAARARVEAAIAA